MDNKWLVGVDIGGTTIKMAMISLNGDLIYSWEVDTDKRGRGRYIPQTIARSIDQKLNELKQTKNRLIGIGVGAPVPLMLKMVPLRLLLTWDGRTSRYNTF